MERTENSFHTLEEEISSVEEYLYRKASVGEENIRWDCRVDPKVDLRILVPGALIKSFVENSLMNEVTQQPEGGKIDISVHRTTLGILIMITDNGLLRYQDYSRGRIIGNRLELLNQNILEFNEKKKCSVNYQLLDLAYTEPGQRGTRVLITIVI